MKDKGLYSALIAVKDANKEIERLARINAELIIKNNELKADKNRLDFLDRCNA